MKFHDGLQKILNDHKPGMVLIEKSWCPTCKKVGDRFIKDQEFHRLSKQFVMIQCIDDEEPNFDEFRPDGSYYPRILFIDSDGNIDYSLANGPESQIYRYFYSNVDACKNNMRKLLEKCGLPA